MSTGALVRRIIRQLDLQRKEVERLIERAPMERRDILRHGASQINATIMVLINAAG